MNNQVLILKNTQKYFEVHESAVLYTPESFRTDSDAYRTKINIHLLNALLYVGIEHHYPSVQGLGSYGMKVLYNNSTV